VTVSEDTTEHLWFGNAREFIEPEPGAILVHKFEDLNENGEFDEGEPMLEGWEFTLTMEPMLEDEMVPLNGVPSVQGATDEDGMLLFDGLMPGEYTVTETLQDGWTNTTPLSQTVTVGENRTAHLWFGNIEEFLPFTELDLAITKSVDKATAEPGELLTYTLKYWNNGETVATNFTIVDDYDERYVTVVDAAGGTVSGGKITWNLAGPLAKEDGFKTVTYTMRVVGDMPEGTTNVDNVVISHPDDSDPTNNTDDARVRVGEPFLPFTGTEALILLFGAVLASVAGLGMRIRASRLLA